LVGYSVIARHERPETSKFYDRASDQIAHEEVERIGI
jgi:hypothetical protein